jgi:hypothetical protein
MSFEGIENIDSFYKEYKVSKNIRKGWVIVNQKSFDKYKNIKLTSADYYSYNSKLLDKNEIIINKQIIIYADTCDKFITIKYNCNFITINISDTEYGTILNPMILMAIVKTKDLEENKQLPKFEDVLSVLGWKITRKALNNIKSCNDYF